MSEIKKEDRITFWCFKCLRILPITERVMVKKKFAYLECCKHCDQQNEREEDLKVAKRIAKKITEETDSEMPLVRKNLYR